MSIVLCGFPLKYGFIIVQVYIRPPAGVTLCYAYHHNIMAASKGWQLSRVQLFLIKTNIANAFNIVQDIILLIPRLHYI